MTTPFIGEIKLFPWDWAPRGWALCNGALLGVNQNQPLFALIGTTYGGDGRTTFGIPDLRGRAAIHRSAQHPVGAADGSEQVTLTLATMPAHIHTLSGTSTAGVDNDPSGEAFANQSATKYYGPDSGPLVAIAPATVGQAGGSLPHPNTQPSLVLNYCIATAGVFPSRN